MPKGMRKVNVKGMKGESGGAWQTWHQNGTRCPKGTVPVRRSTVHDVLRAKSLYEFGKKQRRFSHLSRRSSSSSRVDAPDVVSGNGHEVRAFLSLSSLKSQLTTIIFIGFNNIPLVLQKYDFGTSSFSCA